MFVGRVHCDRTRFQQAYRNAMYYARRRSPQPARPRAAGAVLGGGVRRYPRKNRLWEYRARRGCSCLPGLSRLRHHARLSPARSLRDRTTANSSRRTATACAARCSIKTRLEINLSFNADHAGAQRSRAQRHAGSAAPPSRWAPRFDFHLLRSERSRGSNSICACRCAPHSTVEASPRIIGWTFSPRLNLDHRRIPWDSRVGIIGPAGRARCLPIAATTITSTRSPRSLRPPRRPVYQAVGGYAGTQTICRAVEAISEVSGSAPTCATTRWPARLLSTAPWFSAKATGRLDLAFRLDDPNIIADRR